jgi:hypothetical protein
MKKLGNSILAPSFDALESKLDPLIAGGNEGSIEAVIMGILNDVMYWLMFFGGVDSLDSGEEVLNGWNEGQVVRFPADRAGPS